MSLIKIMSSLSKREKTWRSPFNRRNGLSTSLRFWYSSWVVFPWIAMAFLRRNYWIQSLGLGLLSIFSAFIGAIHGQWDYGRLASPQAQRGLGWAMARTSLLGHLWQQHRDFGIPASMRFSEGWRTVSFSRVRFIGMSFYTGALYGQRLWRSDSRRLSMS